MTPRFLPVLITLEDRTTPAGNVTADVFEGVLYVRGDAQDNAIQIARTGDRSVMIRTTDGSTTVNGSADPQGFGDIFGSYDIRLGEGNNTLDLIGVRANRGLRIVTGSGVDAITLFQVRTDRDAVIDTGAGNDTVRATDNTFNQYTFFDLGAGDDRLDLVGNRAGNRLYYQGGDGNDTVNRIRNRFDSAPKAFNVETSSATQPPTAVNDTASVSPGGSVTINVAANDRGGAAAINPSTVVITNTPSNGRVTANLDGTVTYTAAGGGGTDTFRYTVQDTDGRVSNEATVTVTVTGPDSVRPTTTLTASTATNPTAASPIPFVVTFSESVTGFEASDVTVTNGTVTNFTASGAATFTFGVIPDGDGQVTVRVGEGVAADAAGNTNTAAAVVSVTSIRTDAGMVGTIPDVNAPDWVTQANGLKVWDTVSGTGTSAVSSTSTVTVFYSGWLASDGTLFDSARAVGSPATFALTNLIQGWQQGLPGMKPGGIRRLFIPAALGYGASGSGSSVPPNADLVFEIKLVAVS
jgi:FKBP-type peptidyl-prolyl cis-trans isomerase FkpA